MNLRLVRRHGVTALAILVAATACATEVVAPLQRPTAPAAMNRSVDPGAGNAPAPGRQKTSESAPAATSAGPSPVSCVPHHAVVGSGVFGPGGGTLLFGDSRLIIPGGALRDTVTISATSIGDGTSTVDFQPEGLHFYKPVGLVLDGRDCSLPADGAPSVVYLNDAGDVLESIPAYYDPHWKTVAAPIEHFSGYAIAF